MEHPQEWSALLEVKVLDLRESLYDQCRHAADRGIHIGGAQSAVVPLAALYYGGSFKHDVQNPDSLEQDTFILSKGHAMTALAAIYADKGFFPKEKLRGSRSFQALVRGHPGPAMPGVPAATGPLGHGISIANGFALWQKQHGGYDAYCLVGDGELQEGSCWEGLMFAGEHRLDNLCVLVDRNNGQSDDTGKLVLETRFLSQKLQAFGFRVLEADAANMGAVLDHLETFKRFPRNSFPTAILIHGVKGFGGFSSATAAHKASFAEARINTECALLARVRTERLRALNRFDRAKVNALASNLGYTVQRSESGEITALLREDMPVRVRCAPIREKALRYDPQDLPALEAGQSYGATEVATVFASAFAQDDAFYTIDADLSNVSGLYTGTSLTNRYHALNAGVAECNMMCMAEGLAACGANVWVSTFGPFFDWQAFRRIAVSQQERLEAMGAPDGWLSEGHGLDITFLSTASNLDSGVNGATHMSNDDICFFNQLAFVKVIDICCPRQFLAAARWIAEGNRGLVYMRVMRYASPVLYGADYTFDYGKGYYLREAEDAQAVIISSGHGVLEALSAAESLAGKGIRTSMLDMPSYDGGLLQTLAAKGLVMVFAEQNNGALFDRFSRDLLLGRVLHSPEKIRSLNTRDRNGRLQFIPSGTYEELIAALGLTAKDIVRAVKDAM